MTGNVLFVDDDEECCTTIAAGLRERGFMVSCKASAEEAFAVLDEADWGVLVTDIGRPGRSGLALCEVVVVDRPYLLVVLDTAFGRMELAVSVARAGGYDFVTKPFTIDVLVRGLDRAVKYHRPHTEVKRLREGRRCPG